MKTVFGILLAAAASAASAQDNPLARSARDDWAKYLVTTKNETVPLMSSADQPRWKVVSNVGDGFVRIDAYVNFGGRKAPAGGVLAYFKDRFEPVAGLSKTAKIEVVSSAKETLTIQGKAQACTKRVRKIDQPLDEAAAQSSWVGTSTIWVCDGVPLGLGKMENAYVQRLGKSDKGSKLTETWVLAESGFKNWKE